MGYNCVQELCDYIDLCPQATVKASAAIKTVRATGTASPLGLQPTFSRLVVLAVKDIECDVCESRRTFILKEGVSIIEHAESEDVAQVRTPRRPHHPL